MLRMFKSLFNEKNTKDVLISYGDQFVKVQSNPFAQDAFRDSLRVQEINKIS